MLENRAGDADEIRARQVVDFGKRLAHAGDITFAAPQTATLNLHA
jgi:hypothetical protein